MWHLLRSQFLYQRTFFIVSTLFGIAIASPFIFWIDKPDVIRGFWQAWILLFGILVTTWQWTIEQRERRLLLWHTLSVPRSELAKARLLLPVVIHILYLGMALIGLYISHLTQGIELGTIPRLVLASHGFSLVLALNIYLSEEISVFLQPWRWAVIAFNVVLVAIILIAVLSDFGLFPSSYSWWGVLAVHIAAFGFWYLTYWMFQRRSALMVGINPCSGFPEDWSSAPGSTR